MEQELGKTCLIGDNTIPNNDIYEYAALSLKISDLETRIVKLESMLSDKPNKRTQMARPTIDELIKYAQERGVIWTERNADQFLAFYEARGWKIGKLPMKDWKAAVRTWINGAYERGMPYPECKPTEDISCAYVRYSSGLMGVVKREDAVKMARNGTATMITEEEWYEATQQKQPEVKESRITNELVKAIFTENKQEELF